MTENKHTQAITKSANPDRVRFSSEVTRELTRLEAMVHNSDHFSPEILAELRERASGKPVSVPNAILSIAAIVQETMEHVAATGDERAKEQLDSLIESLIRRRDYEPVSAVSAKSSGKGRS